MLNGKAISIALLITITAASALLIIRVDGDDVWLDYGENTLSHDGWQARILMDNRRPESGTALLQVIPKNNDRMARCRPYLDNILYQSGDLSSEVNSTQKINLHERRGYNTQVATKGVLTLRADILSSKCKTKEGVTMTFAPKTKRGISLLEHLINRVIYG